MLQTVQNEMFSEHLYLTQEMPYQIVYWNTEGYPSAFQTNTLAVADSDIQNGQFQLCFPFAQKFTIRCRLCTNACSSHGTGTVVGQDPLLWSRPTFVGQDPLFVGLDLDELDMTLQTSK